MIVAKRFALALALLVLPVLFSAPAAQAGFAFTPGSVDFTMVNQDGSAVTQAGSHPFEVKTEFRVEGGDLKDIGAAVPAGLVGSATAVPQCDQAQLATNTNHFYKGQQVVGNSAGCPLETQIGMVTVKTSVSGLGFTLPIYNLAAPRGLPAEFGFNFTGLLIYLRPELRSSGDYGFTVSSQDTSQALPVFGAELTLWGVPASSGHDEYRGDCLNPSLNVPPPNGGPSGEDCPITTKPTAFLTMPTSCTGPMTTTFTADSWQAIGALSPDGSADLSDPNWISQSVLTHDAHGNPLGLDGCNKLNFAPTISAAPTTDRATAPTGLDFSVDVKDAGLTNPDGLAQAQIRSARVTLPEGFSINPSAGAGLGVCSEAQFHSETVESEPGAGCPNDSKIGSVVAESTLLGHPVNGSLFIAAEHENPFHTLLALYIVLKDPQTGILVKLAGKVEPNETTGQLVTTFDDLPQIPISSFQLHFRQGQRSPLISPPACGTFTTKAELTPWSGSAPITDESSFTIVRGYDGGPCPTGGLPPFHPELRAGSLDPQAGAFSPFYLKLGRTDGEQEFTHFSIKLPPGLSAKLAGIPACADSAIAAAMAPARTGAEEEAQPSCPTASEIGRTSVGAGVGSVLAYAPGKIYLAGPYHSSQLSIVSITSAKVGPFDLGTVVVRFGLKINPETAEVFVDPTGSDPIPHIIDGIPVHLREIRTEINRPQFTLNPTNCDSTSTASTVLGSGLDFASEADNFPVTVSSPFRVANCAALGFKPKLALSLKGGTARGATPAFKAVLTARPGDANIGEAQVTLPRSEFLEQSHIKTVCTRVQFKEGTVPGEKCPAASIYGRARAVTPILDEPLEGPVYLRSSSHQLPDLVAALNNKQVSIDLDGRIDSVKGRIRNTFEAVPDAPVTKFTLEMKGGKKGLLTNSTNLCTQKNRAVSHFVGQNGKVHDTNPVLQAQCGAKGKKGKGAKKSGAH